MKAFLSLLLILVSLSMPVGANAETLDVLIVRVQTESLASASEESITLANNSAHVVDLSDWYIQYFAASSSFDSPSRNIPLSGSLAPHDQFTAASSGYLTGQSDVTFGAGLAAAGGHVRLVSGSDLYQHDLIGWGTAINPEGTAISAAAKDQAYERKSNQYGTYQDLDNNAEDFTNGSVTPVDSPHNEEVPQITESLQSNSAIRITELLPDPASPSTDAEGEFIEIYNEGSEVVSLNGFKLQSGTNNTYTFTFKGGSIDPGEFQTFYSSTTKLTLSNTSGKARLLDASGQVISETAIYGKAPNGSSWMFNGSEWEWTASPTPGAVNGSATTGSVKSSTSAKTTSPKATKATASKAAASSKAKATKKSDGTTTYTDYKDPASDNKAVPISPLLLAIVGVPLVGYMIYEYRHDMGNLLSKLRRNRTNSGQARPVTSGR